MRTERDNRQEVPDESCLLEGVARLEDDRREEDEEEVVGVKLHRLLEEEPRVIASPARYTDTAR